jgi:sugar phosphate isomerase/epimerase
LCYNSVMYYSMDNMGNENVVRLMQLSSDSEKWEFIAQIASGFGFAGIQIGPTYQNKYGLSFTCIPDYIRKSFRLTYHIEGIYHLKTTEDEEKIQERLAESLKIAVGMGAEDVSLHPPLLSNLSLHSPHLPDKSPDRRAETRKRLNRLLVTWIPHFEDQGMTLSLETHVTSAYFIFTGIPDFQDFALNTPGLGVLADISHNSFDGYKMPELLNCFRALRMTGFHLSDAAVERGFPDGTHLPIGQGHVDFKSLVSCYGSNNKIYGALEIRGPAQAISDSLACLRKLE